jgi:hypothetical protein
VVSWSGEDLVTEVCDFAEIFPNRFFLELQSNEAPGQKDINDGPGSAEPRRPVSRWSSRWTPTT